jgi:hypothetical protein
MNSATRGCRNTSCTPIVRSHEDYVADPGTPLHLRISLPQSGNAENTRGPHQAHVIATPYGPYQESTGGPLELRFSFPGDNNAENTRAQPQAPVTAAANPHEDNGVHVTANIRRQPPQPLLRYGNIPNTMFTQTPPVAATTPHEDNAGNAGDLNIDIRIRIKQPTNAQTKVHPSRGPMEGDRAMSISESWTFKSI